ncbi:MAG: zeta toxin family protein [Planctomycetes bacterium]|nr:zeta toxin family protein [Planctomycetota bacterium]
MEFGFLDERPIVIAITGSNGAGKTTFYWSHLADTGLWFINADDLTRELNIGPYEAAEVAAALRHVLVQRRESFIFETVLSDPVGEKVRFLRDCAAQGYQVAMIFIRLADVGTSLQRVSMRVAQGGHDVPDQKLHDRFERTVKNLKRAIQELPHVLVYDNSDLARPYQLVEVWEDGRPIVVN